MTATIDNSIESKKPSSIEQQIENIQTKTLDWVNNFVDLKKLENDELSFLWALKRLTKQAISFVFDENLNSADIKRFEKMTEIKKMIAEWILKDWVADNKDLETKKAA